MLKLYRQNFGDRLNLVTCEQGCSLFFVKVLRLTKIHGVSVMYGWILWRGGYCQCCCYFITVSTWMKQNFYDVTCYLLKNEPICDAEDIDINVVWYIFDIFVILWIFKSTSQNYLPSGVILCSYYSINYLSLVIFGQWQWIFNEGGEWCLTEVMYLSSIECFQCWTVSFYFCTNVNFCTKWYF